MTRISACSICLLWLFFEVALPPAPAIAGVRSGINKMYSEHFVLEPDDLRRIVGVLSEHGTRLGTNTIVRFNVQRKDDRFYYATKLEEVLADPNIRSAQIQLLGIELVNRDRKPEPWEKEEWSAVVAFDSKNGAHLLVYDEDRNWALLLADALEPHIKRTFRMNNPPRWLFHSIIFLLFALALRVTHHTMVQKKNLDTAYTFTMFILILGTISVVGDFLNLFSFVPIQNLYEKLAPVSVFQWGDIGEKYVSERILAHSLFWGLIVAFTVSLSANILTHLYFSRQTGRSARTANNPSHPTCAPSEDDVKQAENAQGEG